VRGIKGALGKHRKLSSEHTASKAAQDPLTCEASSEAPLEHTASDYQSPLQAMNRVHCKHGCEDPVPLTCEASSEAPLEHTAES